MKLIELEPYEVKGPIELDGYKVREAIILEPYSIEEAIVLEKTKVRIRVTENDDGTFDITFDTSFE